jgi:hypothetical protein
VAAFFVLLLQRLSQRKGANTYLLIAKVLGTCVHVNGRSNQSQAQNISQDEREIKDR